LLVSVKRPASVAVGEDQPLIRTGIVRVLEDAGMEVESGEERAELIAQRLEEWRSAANAF
jgi:hypothetical protein